MVAVTGNKTVTQLIRAFDSASNVFHYRPVIGASGELEIWWVKFKELDGPIPASHWLLDCSTRKWVRVSDMTGHPRCVVADSESGSQLLTFDCEFDASPLLFQSYAVAGSDAVVFNGLVLASTVPADKILSQFYQRSRPKRKYTRKEDSLHETEDDVY